MCVRVRVRVCARARTHWHTWVTYPYNTYIYVRVDTPGLRIPTIHTCMYVLTHHTWVLDIISSPRFTADCDAADKSNVSVLHNHLFIRGHAGDVRVSWACRGRCARGGGRRRRRHTHTHTRSCITICSLAPMCACRGRAHERARGVRVGNGSASALTPTRATHTHSHTPHPLLDLPYRCTYVPRNTSERVANFVACRTCAASSTQQPDSEQHR